MSPTFLELAVALILLVVAWQLGLALAPIVFSKLHELKHDLDNVSDDIVTEDETSQDTYRKDHSHGTHC